MGCIYFETPCRGWKMHYFLWQWSKQKTVDESLQPKAELHGRKVMLCEWWDQCCIIHFMFLNDNQTLNADLYFQQLQHVHENLLRKCFALIWRGNIVLLHDNTKPHSVRIKQEKILDLSWSVLLHPPYLPDFLPSDFHVFCSLQNAMNDQKFFQENQVRMFVGKLLELENQLNFTWEEKTSNLIN